MPERPPAIERLDSLLSAAMIAHEAIFEMRRKLIATDRANPEQARLLDLEGAARTLAELEAELNRVEPASGLCINGSDRSPGSCAQC
jgi:hypothetical protein